LSLIGAFSPPGDKSISHRLALMALAANGETRVTNLSDGDDVATSLKIAERMGAKVVREQGSLLIRGGRPTDAPELFLDCGNSGTTTRLLMGILAGLPGTYTLSGDESLNGRPMERVAIPLRLMGANITTQNDRPPVVIRGKALKGVQYRLPVASAQLKSAILLAGLFADSPTTVIEPIPSRDHTERMIRLFGGSITTDGERITVQPSNLTFTPDFRVPGDISSAAFFLCAAAVIPGSRVTAQGILLNPTRTGLLPVLKRMGVDIEIQEKGHEPEPFGDVTVSYSPDLKAAIVRPEEIPLLVDEVPVLALVAGQANGRTVFQGAGELRVKETDRLTAVADQLGAMGANIIVNGDELVVDGPTPLKTPDRLESYGDHRMAMMLRLASRLAGCDGLIVDEECAAISYAAFHQDLERMWQ
jgi:3-phosphoshikimate 1-carboxyvinyltransferase